ncbi:HNH endonuclease [Pirellulaceae bacterium]|nr:HNH endonuclease signature motif containing protein [Mariniblastus sp.]MDB4756424.1 HNH endonuclease [Mariniblastus sp.]MDB4794407.1 HNH endonuclease [Pirellulaceae bacterium]
MNAWLMLTKKERIIAGEDYDDDLSRHYSWDDTVPNHASPSEGDVIILWDSNYLLGASVIETIAKGKKTKGRLRCPECNIPKMQARKKLKPKYRCGNCQVEVDDPVIEEISVISYRANYRASWIDMCGAMDGQKLKSLCLRPKSQHSIRELNWSDFQHELPQEIHRPVSNIMKDTKNLIKGGHKTRLGKVRIGQAEFRKRLLDKYGETCALSGPAPSQAIDAAHLYSYAKTGEQDDMGGLLIRKDLHHLFDLGLIKIDPKTLLINVDDLLLKYSAYQSLNNKKIAVKIQTKTKRWIKKHWELHCQADS